MSQINAKPLLKNDATRLRCSDRVHFGHNVVFGPRCRIVNIGFGTFIGNDVYIDVEELSIGEYTTIHHGAVLSGIHLSIGHNNWIGHYTILDALGGRLQLGNNVGVGAHSQLWSHMQFGDRLHGCRFYNQSALLVEDDVWFVGHCIVSPIRAEKGSMLLSGGVATKDMHANRVYAGTPAQDITDKTGPQFQVMTSTQRQEIFAGYVEEYRRNGHDTAFIIIAGDEPVHVAQGETLFHLTARTYRPTYGSGEYAFMKFLLYDRAKFVPVLGDGVD